MAVVRQTFLDEAETSLSRRLLHGTAVDERADLAALVRSWPNAVLLGRRIKERTLRPTSGEGPPYRRPSDP